MANHTVLKESQNLLAAHPLPCKRAETAGTACTPSATSRILDQENKGPKTPEGYHRIRRWIHSLPNSAPPSPPPPPPSPSPSAAGSVSHLGPARKRPRPLTATQLPNTQRPSKNSKGSKQLGDISQQPKKRRPQAQYKKPQKKESSRRSQRIAVRTPHHLPRSYDDTGPSTLNSPI